MPEFGGRRAPVDSMHGTTVAGPGTRVLGCLASSDKQYCRPTTEGFLVGIQLTFMEELEIV
jgi:hypothetical protein